MIGAISVAGIDLGAEMAPIVVVDVFEAGYDDLPCRAWTREELMASDFEDLVERDRATLIGQE
jgi:hypothetical protein